MVSLRRLHKIWEKTTTQKPKFSQKKTQSLTFHKAKMPQISQDFSKPQFSQKASTFHKIYQSLNFHKISQSLNFHKSFHFSQNLSKPQFSQNGFKVKVSSTAQFYNFITLISIFSHYYIFTWKHIIKYLYIPFTSLY